MTVFINFHSIMITYRSVISCLFVLALIVGGSATPGRAQDQSSTEAEIRQMLKERDQQIKAILKRAGQKYTQQQRAELKELINGVIDFWVMGQRALGPHWADLTDEQQEEFVAVFSDVVRAQSMSDLGVYNSKVTYGKIVVQGDSAFVHTQTQYEGRSTPVEYVLERRDGEWRAEDIIIDGVSTAEGYARSFQNVIRQRGFETLMKSLRKKRDETTSTSQG